MLDWIFDNIKKSLGMTVVVIVTICIALNSFTIVEPGEAKVGVLFGKVQNEVLTEGFHVVNPMVDFSSYSIKDFTVTYDNITVPAQDKLKSKMDLMVTIRAQTVALPRMKREAGTLKEAYDKYVTPRIFSLLRECGKGVKQSQDFFNEETQNEMQDFMLANLREQLKPLGFDVSIALFSDVTLPTLVQNAIEQTKDREEKINQERAQLEIVALEQQKAVKIAEAKRDSSVSQAEAIETLAKAEAFRIESVAKAQAEANNLLQKSVTPTLVDYIRANNWNGVMPTTMLGNATPMIQLN